MFHKVNLPMISLTYKDISEIHYGPRNVVLISTFEHDEN